MGLRDIQVATPLRFQPYGVPFGLKSSSSLTQVNAPYPSLGDVLLLIVSNYHPQSNITRTMCRRYYIMTDNNNQLVQVFLLSNTTAGTSQTMPDGSKVFYPKVDADGKREYTTNIKFRTSQVDKQFPQVLKAKGLKSVVKSYALEGQTLLIVPNVDYQLTRKPQILESDDSDMEPVAIAYYKPIIRRVEAKVSDHKGLF